MIRVNGKDRSWRKGMTVADLIQDLNDPFPYAVVRINDRHVSRLDFETTPIQDGSDVFLIQMVAGG